MVSLHNGSLLLVQDNDRHLDFRLQLKARVRYLNAQRQVVAVQIADDIVRQRIRRYVTSEGGVSLDPLGRTITWTIGRQGLSQERLGTAWPVLMNQLVDFRDWRRANFRDNLERAKDNLNRQLPDDDMVQYRQEARLIELTDAADVLDCTGYFFDAKEFELCLRGRQIGQDFAESLYNQLAEVFCLRDFSTV